MRLRQICVAGLLVTFVTPAIGKSLIAPWPIPPIQIDPPTCPTDPPPGYTYRWVGAVYRTLTERVWIPETTREVEYWVQITPDRWERRWRTVIIPGHFDSVTRRVLVSEGYWQLVRLDRHPPRPIPLPMERPSGTVGVDGYSRTPTEDLSKFSGLSEWPDKK